MEQTAQAAAHTHEQLCAALRERARLDDLIERLMHDAQDADEALAAALLKAGFEPSAHRIERARRAAALMELHGQRVAFYTGLHNAEEAHSLEWKEVEDYGMLDCMSGKRCPYAALPPSLLRRSLFVNALDARRLCDKCVQDEEPAERRSLAAVLGWFDVDECWVPQLNIHLTSALEWTALGPLVKEVKCCCMDCTNTVTQWLVGTPHCMCAEHYAVLWSARGTDGLK